MNVKTTLVMGLWISQEVATTVETSFWMHLLTNQRPGTIYLMRAGGSNDSMNFKNLALLMAVVVNLAIAVRYYTQGQVLSAITSLLLVAFGCLILLGGDE